MKAEAPLQREQIDPVRTVHRLKGFDEIFDDQVDGVIWDRQVPISVGLLLNAMPSDTFVSGRSYLAVDEVGGYIENLFSDWSAQAAPVQRWLADDVQTLAHQFAQILLVSSVRLRVEWVHDNACRKFHRDAVRVRLICTYSGPGTEYGVAQGGEMPPHVDTVPTGCPIFLKGKLWSPTPKNQIVHRSPPIEGTGTSRLVIVLDEASA